MRPMGLLSFGYGYFFAVRLLSIFYLGRAFSSGESALGRVSAELCPTTTAVIRSFEPDRGLVDVLLVGTLSEATSRVRGSDRSTVARLRRGEPIQFELVRDRHGHECAIDVAIL
jgi:hypothetical protein